MTSFDDLAFADVNAMMAAAVSQLFCRDCNEISQTTTAAVDGKRCLICGCDLVRRQELIATEETAAFNSSETSAETLQTMMMHLLTNNNWNGAGDVGARRPASDEAVKNLGSFSADQASTVEVAIIVEGIKGEVIAIPGNFGPCESLQEKKMVIADPFDGASAFHNFSELKEKIVVMIRGGCTFAQKILRAQAAGAAGVLIVQTADVWPYTMTDSSGQIVKIPAFMMSAKVGERFVAFLRTKYQEGVMATFIVRKDARECAICQVDMLMGARVTKMPCQHMFHTACLHEWLQIGNSCPICRVEIAAKGDANHQNSRHSQSAQQRGDFAWSEWFS